MSKPHGYIRISLRDAAVVNFALGDASTLRKALITSGGERKKHGVLLGSYLILQQRLKKKAVSLR